MRLEKPEIHWNALDVLAHQVVGLTIDFGEISINDAWKTVKRCYAYKDLSYEKFLQVLEFLEQIKLIRVQDSKIIKTRKGLLYYIENLSMIPDEKSYDVIDISTRSKIGVLHEEFVSKHGTPGTIFIIRGLPWKIEKIERNKVFVSLEKDFESAIPSWEGELLPVPFEIAQKAQEIKKKLIYELEELKGQENFFIPDPSEVVIEGYKDWIIIHAPFGTKVNDTLSRVISYEISTRYGVVVGIKTDPYRILLKVHGVQKEDVKNILKSLPLEIEDVLRRSLENTDLFLWKFSHVAKRFGVIRKDADYSKTTLKRIAQSLRESPVYEETFNEIFVEKLDIRRTKEIIKAIKDGEIKIRIVNRERPSPLAVLGLEQVVSDVLISGKWRETLKLVKERLENMEFYFICMNCKTTYKIKVKDWKPMKCEKCFGEYFGVLKELKFDEKTLNATAELLKYYGKLFLLAYAGRGISYITASRILRQSRSEEDLIQRIIEEEKRFFKIRRWIFK